MKFFSWAGIILFFISGLALPVRAAAIPNGLAIIGMTTGQFGHGFVVGNKIISVGHVLYYVHTVFVSESGQWVNADQFIKGETKIHPDFLPGQETIPSALYDLGAIELTKSLRTDFVLEPLSAEDAVISNTWFVASTLKTFRNAIYTMKEPPLEIKFTRISPTKVGVRVGSDVVPNAYLDTNISFVRGQSGSPLFVKLQSGKFLVKGIASGLSNIPGLAGEKIRKDHFSFRK
jgi:hypothetical protein